MGVLAGKIARIEGPVKVGRSSAFADRAHCETCGTAIWHRFRPSGEVTLGQGLFEDQTGWRMVREIFCHERPAHYAFGGAATAYTGWGFLWALITGRLAK